MLQKKKVIAKERDSRVDSTSWLPSVGMIKTESKRYEKSDPLVQSLYLLLAIESVWFLFISFRKFAEYILGILDI